MPPSFILNSLFSRASLKIEQETLSPKAASVAGQLSVVAYDAVTGDHDGKAILADRPGHRAGTGGASDSSGQFAVGEGLTVGHLKESFPDLLLVLGSGGVDWGSEPGEFPLEIELNLFLELLERSTCPGEKDRPNSFFKDRKLPFQHAPIPELEQIDGLVVRHGHHWPEG